MKKLITLGAASLALLFSLNSVQAAELPQWNASGTWNVAFDYLGSTYTHDMMLTQDATGTITGTGGYPAGGPHSFAWMIDNGSLTGNTLHLDTHYTLGAACAMTINGVVATSGTMSGTWSDNCGGARGGTWTTSSGAAIALGSLAAEDFGIVNYDTGLGILKGFTAGFGLQNATFANVQSVVVKLYSGSTLLQTNTATTLVGSTILGNQISSPFDVFGTFNYVTDGYWVNTRGSEYGQTMVPTKVVATVVLANGKTVTAENTLLTGDPATIYPAIPVPPTTPTNKNQCKNNGWKNFTNPSFKNQGLCVSYTNHH